MTYLKVRTSTLLAEINLALRVTLNLDRWAATFLPPTNNVDKRHNVGYVSHFQQKVLQQSSTCRRNHLNQQNQRPVWRQRQCVGLEANLTLVKQATNRRKNIG